MVRKGGLGSTLRHGNLLVLILSRNLDRLKFGFQESTKVAHIAEVAVYRLRPGLRLADWLFNSCGVYRTETLFEDSHR